MTGDKNGDVLSYIIGKGMPIFLLLFNILWLISLNISYFEDINKGIVSKDFYEYSMLNNILIFVQILISLEIINLCKSARLNRLLKDYPSSLH